MIRLLRRLLRCRLLLAAWTGSWVLTASAQACVRLEWRTPTPVVSVGDPVDIGLYAVSVPDSPGDDPDETLIAADIFFGWDNASLEFLGLEDPEYPNVRQSGLLCPDTFCRANENCPTESPDPYPPPSDGTGLYRLTSEPRQSLTATPEGLLLTTFRFRTLAAAPAASVEIQIGRFPCVTRIFDDKIPGVDLLCWNGGYGFIEIEIIGEPCVNASGDVNDDGRLNGADVLAFVSVFQNTPNGPPDLGFCSADLNEDGIVNLMDAELLITALLAP